MNDNKFIKKAFFDHLLRQGFTREHTAVYDDYFDFFRGRLGQAQIMDLEPEAIYRVALASVDELDGDDVIEAYLEMMEFFMTYWSERWEAMHPDEEDSSAGPPPSGDNP